MTLFFCVVTPCRLVGRCQRFGEIYCLHLQAYLRDYKASQSRRIMSSSSPTWEPQILHFYKFFAQTVYIELIIRRWCLSIFMFTSGLLETILNTIPSGAKTFPIKASFRLIKVHFRQVSLYRPNLTHKHLDYILQAVTWTLGGKWKKVTLSKNLYKKQLRRTERRDGNIVVLLPSVKHTTRHSSVASVHE
jgi:hypothetical protein